MRLKCLIVCLFGGFYLTPAYAYLGPGLGTGALAVILGIIGSVLLALFAIFWYPIKKLFKKNTGANKEKSSPEMEETAPEPQNNQSKDMREGDS